MTTTLSKFSTIPMNKTLPKNWEEMSQEELTAYQLDLPVELVKAGVKWNLSLGNMRLILERCAFASSEELLDEAVSLLGSSNLLVKYLYDVAKTGVIMEHPMNEEELLSLISGFTLEQVKDLRKRLIPDEVVGIGRALGKHAVSVDTSYIQRDTIRDVMSSGVKLLSILKENYGNEIGRHIYTGLYPDASFSLNFFEGCYTGMRYVSRAIVRTLVEDGYVDIPDYVMRYNNGSLLVARWAMRHLNQLDKVREVYAPGGEVFHFHIHTLLEHVTEDMLTNGVKTAWRRVYADLQEAMQQRTSEMLKENRELPQHPLKEQLEETGKIKQLVSSHALKYEGEVMNHCVGGYLNSCMDEKSYIFHVEDDSEYGATVEVIPTQDGWEVVQSMNVGNVHSPLAAKIVEDTLSKARIPL